MQNNLKAIVQNYCGFPVEVIEVNGYVNDERRGKLVRAQVRYPDNFEVPALLKESEIELQAV